MKKKRYKKIRKFIFETNSSSTHSICIAKGQRLMLTIPESLHFEFGNFGWEADRLSTVHEKASYLYTAMVLHEKQAEFLDAVHFLRGLGISISYDLPFYDTTEGLQVPLNSGHIDHYYDLRFFVKDMCGDFKKIKRFLFSPLSYILTGNDNSDTDVDIKESYPHEVYYKGN